MAITAKLSKRKSLKGSVSGVLYSVNMGAGIDTSDATATESDIAMGQTAYVNGEKVTGTHVCESYAELPELTDPGAATDLAIGKELIDADGNIVTGTLSEYKEGDAVSTSLKSVSGGSTFAVTGTVLEDAIVRKGATVRQWITPTKFGDATAADVAAGKTFTSSTGLLVEGTHECENGMELPTLTNPGTADDLVEGMELIDQSGAIVTGTIPKKTSSDLTSSGATVTVPAGYYSESVSATIADGSVGISISINDSGKITATASKTAGYIQGGSVSTTKQLTTQAAQTITPGTADQTIASGTYLTGDQTIQGDGNLVPANIKSGISIFGVTGSHECEADLDTSDATATAYDMAEGVTAYVNGEKITGALPHETVSISLNSGRISWSTIGLAVPYVETATKRIVGDGATLTLLVPKADLGDATATDVAAGKTFTSSSGLMVTGTNVGSSTALQTKTVTPGSSEQTITPDSGYDGLSSVVVEGDANLVAENIKEGVSIFGIVGSLAASSDGGYASGDVVKAAATSATLLSGYNATSIVYGEKVSASDGTVALSGLTTTLSISNASSFDGVKGKYVKTSSGSIYYIPSDATITQSGTTYSKTYTADKANLMFVLA